MWAYGIPAAAVTVIMFGIYSSIQYLCDSQVYDARHQGLKKSIIGKIQSDHDYQPTPEERAILHKSTLALRWEGLMATLWGNQVASA